MVTNLPLEDSTSRVVVLVVTPSEIDHAVLHRIFSHCRWEVQCVRSIREASAIVGEGIAAVVLCDASLPDGNWKNLLNVLDSSRPPTRLIVTSHHADDFLWSEVLNLGGYDVLLKPFDPSEVFRVISLAWRHLTDEVKRKPRVAAAAATSRLA
ncbi:MAG: response regulator [Bryobacteraceae bacterium]